MPKIEYVEKRSGDIVPFTPDRITNAIYRAAGWQWAAVTAILPSAERSGGRSA